MERIVLEFPQFPLKQDQSDKFWVLPPPQKCQATAKRSPNDRNEPSSFLTGIGEKNFQ